MTLNPFAQAFIPSSDTLKLVANISSSTSVPGNSMMNHEYPPPQLESLFLDVSEAQEEREALTQLSSQPLSGIIDYTNFDLPFFIFDMMTADSEDFMNYLSDRAEYLLGYAGTSETYACDIVDSILDSVLNCFRRDRNRRDCRRPLKLAAEMCDMNEAFLQLMVERIIQILDNLRHSRNHDLNYTVLLSLMLNELHIGTCVEIPQSKMLINDVYEHFLSLLQEEKSAVAAVVAIEQCELQLKKFCEPLQIENLCSTLRKVSGRNSSLDFQRCNGLQRKLRQPTYHSCSKRHALPVAQLNNEENEAFEKFLQENAMRFSSLQELSTTLKQTE